MEQIAQGWNNFLNLPWIQYLILNCNWVDWITVACLVVGAVYGLRKGLLRMFVEIAELLIIIYLIIEYGDMVGEKISAFFPKLSLWIIQVFVMTAGCILLGLVVSLIDKVFQKWVHANLVTPLKMIGGALCGCFYFLLIWSLCVHIMLIPPQGQQIRTQYVPPASKTGTTVIKIVPESYRVISEVTSYISSGARTIVKKGRPKTPQAQSQAEYVTN